MASESDKKTAQLEPELREMKLEEGATNEGQDQTTQVKVEPDFPARTPTPSAIPPRLKSRPRSQSPAVKQGSEAPSPSSITSHEEEVVGGDITLKMEPGKTPKLSRTAPQRVVARPPPLFVDSVDATEEAKETFAVLAECSYANKHIGTTDPALECDCSEEWGGSSYLQTCDSKC